MIHSIAEFIDYFAGIRRRTLTYVAVIPADQLDWAPKAGEFTCGDIVRHLGAAERMFAHLISEREWKYPGHEGSTPQSKTDMPALLDASHAAAMATLRRIDDTELSQPRPSFLPDGPSIKVWRLLMAMVEHEIHHRSQLATYLSLMGCDPPQIYGITVEDLIARATE